MEEIKKILVPIDFSDYSKKALQYSVQFAKSFGANISLIYVIERAVYPADFSMGQIAVPAADMDLHERAKEELKNLAASEISGDVGVEIILKTGKPYVEIIEAATDIDADLIIIATHGHTGIEHLLFGSTAERVVRKAPCPVLTLREPIKGFKFNE